MEWGLSLWMDDMLWHCLLVRVVWWNHTFLSSLIPLIEVISINMTGEIVIVYV